MNPFILYIVLLIFALTAGCANVPAQTVNQPTAAPPVEVAPQSLQQIAAADLRNAIAQATADKDTVALQCWTVLQTNLPTINKPLPTVNGVASAIQAKRSIKARIDAGLPPEVVSGCATLYVQEHFGVMKDLMTFLGLVKP